MRIRPFRHLLWLAIILASVSAWALSPDQEPPPKPAVEKLKQPKPHRPKQESKETQSIKAERLFWDSIKNGKNPMDFKAYLEQYPHGRFAPLARDRLGSSEDASQPVNQAQSVLRQPFEPEMVRMPVLGVAIGKYEVTQGEWIAVMGSNPSHFSSCGDRCPVEQVSWDDVQGYIQQLNQRTEKHYRLPTEDEWFNACQAGTQIEYCGSNDVDTVAWNYENSENHTHQVGQESPNAWGLYDMSGNVWEWTSSCWEGDCSMRVLRGGSWADEPAGVHSSYRVRGSTSYRGVGVGFRLAQD